MAISGSNLRTSTATWVVGILVMAAVLVAVAVFQYRWSVQATETAEARIANDLQSFMMDWGLDLFEDLSAVCISLQIEPDSGASDDWHTYLSRYREWRHTSDESELVEGVFIWETSREKEPALFALDPDNMRLRHASVTDELRPLLTRLDKNSSSLEIALQAWELATASGTESTSLRPPPGQKHSTIGWQFDPHIPAIVHPVVHHALPADAPRPRVTDRVDWIVVRISSDALRKQILPELTRQHFGGIGGAPKYALEIVAPTWPNGVLYSSRDEGKRESDSFAAVESPDAEMNIFGPPPSGIGDRPLQSAITEVSIRSVGDRRLSAPTWFPVIQYTAGERPWVLLVDDLSEPLATSFARIRQKNLLISGLVLAVLTMAMGLTLMATHRAQVMARQQIEFVAAVSHELGTSLAVISSAAENIADGVVESKPSVRQYGSLIKHQGRQLSELVNDILLFASIRNGRSHYTLRPIAVSQLLETLLANTSDLTRDAGFTIEKVVQPNLPAVNGDFQALSHCLQNLVINAVKYGTRGRWLGIRAFATDALDSSRQEVCIAVADHGIGIQASELRHIFQPFYRSPAVTAAQIRGTGLGLAIAKNIAEAMGGSLTVTSQVGAGSVFTVHLRPANAAPEAATNRATPDPVGQS